MTSLGECSAKVAGLTNDLPEAIPNSTDSDSSSDTEYFFENDPLFLKNNSDYQRLLKCQIKLQAQRTAAVKNLEHLLELWDYGNKKPMQFVEDLSAGKLQIPEKVTIDELPNIDWSKYSLDDLKSTSRPNTRTRLAASKAAPAQQQASSQKGGVAVTVRGRLYDASKPQTFNQPWTRDEQRRLDELLVMFPPEHIAANRYRKIAEELGTRSSIQVQSRLQKYSIALKKNKIALPGYKTPSLNVMRKQSGYHRRRASHWSESRSTFITAHDLDHDMDHGAGSSWGTRTATAVKDEHIGGAIGARADYSSVKQEAVKDELGAHRQQQQYSLSDCVVSSDDEAREAGSGDPDQLRLSALRRVRAWKSKEQQQRTALHHTFRCYVCGQSPIEGSRFHCLDCDASKTEANTATSSSSSSQSAFGLSVDLCSICYREPCSGPSLAAVPGGGVGDCGSPLSHQPSHRLQEIPLMLLSQTMERLIASQGVHRKM